MIMFKKILTLYINNKASEGFEIRYGRYIKRKGLLKYINQYGMNGYLQNIDCIEKKGRKHINVYFNKNIDINESVL